MRVYFLYVFFMERSGIKDAYKEGLSEIKNAYYVA